MVALVNSDYAVTSDGSKIYLYYQYNDDNNLYQIREIASSNGSSWTENKVVVAENPSPGGSPITAYYVAHDGTADMKSTVHVFYLDASGKLHEKVKLLSQGTSWGEHDLSGIKDPPIATSRLSSGTCHDNSSGAHQWLFFESETSDTPEIAELRSGSSSQFKWNPQKISPRKPQLRFLEPNWRPISPNPLTTCSFKTMIVISLNAKPVTKSGTEPILPKDKVGISTPLAVTNSSTAGQPYLFYASQIPSQKVMLYNNSKLSEVSKHYSGTMFGAITFNGKVYLFHKPLEHTVEVWTRVYDGNTWKLGARVIA